MAEGENIVVQGERGPKGARGPNGPNEIGNVYGRLTVVAEMPRYVEPSGHVSRQVECRCLCGTHATVLVKKLRSGHTQSCGCLQRERTAAVSTVHGHSRRGARTPTHTSWRAMKERCLNTNHTDYHRYGGRGVSIHEGWLGVGGFERFLADMGERPEWATGGLDRIDPDGNYKPDNCRWATASEQRLNQRPRRTT